MEFRSKSCRNPSLQIENYSGGRVAPTSMHDLRSYSTNYAGSSNYDQKGKFGKASKSWSFSDPELQRKKRVAGYKVYDVEGKMKGSLKKSLKWIKNTCNKIW
ncbi:hypothetical protein P8452_68756 [Trifolium repens]|jgi:hypothetical protein|nr:hypothetical protein QL285_042167 [Trifolium repens]WJX86447.1 hypothetical protein P8452_68756 [Trifolium repens]